MTLIITLIRLFFIKGLEKRVLIGSDNIEPTFQDSLKDVSLTFKFNAISDSQSKSVVISRVKQII